MTDMEFFKEIFVIVGIVSWVFLFYFFVGWVGYTIGYYKWPQKLWRKIRNEHG